MALPASADIIELGSIQPDKVIEKFESIDWANYLQLVETMNEKDVHFSPSLEIENSDTHHGLCISAVGSPGNYEFYIFYKRPEKVKLLFGLLEKMNNNYTSNKTGQTKQDVVVCLNALIRNDTDFLATKIGR